MQTEISARSGTERRFTPPPEWEWKDGIGYLPLEGVSHEKKAYDEAYFRHYQELAGTSRGILINRLRMDLVERWADHRPKLDIGIGSGAFIQGMRQRKHVIYGQDINPVACEWIRQNKFERIAKRCSTLTFWDVLEHIQGVEGMIKFHDPQWIFLSMPIYQDEIHVFHSKHYKPGEHCWYFTEQGLRLFMDRLGYVPVEINSSETIKAGREGILSFAFKLIDL